MKAKILIALFVLAILSFTAPISFGQPTQVSYRWTKTIGSSLDDYANSIATDMLGNIYVTGYFSATANFGLDFETTDIKTSAGGADIFITKINSNGTYGWTKVIGGTSDDQANSIAIDSSGNIYVTGYFSGLVNFGFDFGRWDMKSSAGYKDIFITKINPNGTYGWTKKIGGISPDVGYGITTDSIGSVYVTGSFMGSVNFGLDFGTTDIKTTLGGGDAFITKINSNGAYGWTKKIGEDLVFCEGYAITTDSIGSVYVTGFFANSINFGFDFGTTDIKTSLAVMGVKDAFITKINSDGTYGWTKAMGGSDDDYGSGVVTDRAGDVYVKGNFKGTVNFGLDFGLTDIKTNRSHSFWTFQASSIFVTKIKSNGTYGWTKAFNGTSIASEPGFAIDSLGNIYVTGCFLFDIDCGFDFGVSDLVLALWDVYITLDIFVTKIDANGNYGWTQRMGGEGNDIGCAIATDTAGNVYLTGRFSLTVDFGLDFGATEIKTSAGSYDIFIAKLKSGDLSSQVVMPPENPTFSKVVNNYIFYKEYINRVTWQAPSRQPAPIAKYIIYRTGQWSDYKPVAEVEASIFKYEQRNIRKGDIPYTYRITSVDIYGRESRPVQVNY
jgi:hypothetical protein